MITEVKEEFKVAFASQAWLRDPCSAIAAALLLILLALLCEPARAQNKPEQPVEIRVIARRFQFDPGTITVQKGRSVKLVITSEDATHGFAIKEFGIKETVEAKQTRTIEFMPDKSGRFRIYCTVYCGEGHEDMAGELIVEEQQSASVGNIKVAFDERAPGVVFVEANGERIRIDTNTRTVAQIAEQPAPPAHTSHQSEVAKAEQPTRPAAEPYDYRLINVPTPKRVLRHSLNLYFTHRFSEPVRPLSQSGRDLIGLDSFAISALGVFYGVTDKLYVNAYRSPVCQTGLCKTIEIGVGYHLLDEGGRSPVALSTYASIEGDDNFTEHFTYNFQAMIARSVGKYVNLFFSPALHVNANGQRRFNPRAEDFFPPLPLANEFKLNKHTGSFGFGVNARIRPSVSLLFEYTPRVGFKLGQITPIFTTDFSRITGFKNDSQAEIGFGIEKDLGRHSFSLTFSNTQTTTTSRYNSSNLALPPSRFTIGFNLYRRFLK